MCPSVPIGHSLRIKNTRVLSRVSLSQLSAELIQTETLQSVRAELIWSSFCLQFELLARDCLPRAELLPLRPALIFSALAGLLSLLLLASSASSSPPPSFGEQAVEGTI